MSFKQNIGGLLAIGLILIALLSLPTKIAAPCSGAIRDALAPLPLFFTQAFSFCRKAIPENEASSGHNARQALEIGRLRYEIQQLKFLEQENAELRHLLGLEAQSKYSLIAARVTARAIGGWWEMVRLDQGITAGVKRDMPVVSGEGVVGRVVQATPRTADVLLLVDPSSKVSAKITRMDAFGIVRGQGVSLRGDPLCRMDFILKEADILPGDEVVTSGLGGVYPAGLVIGYVEKVYLDRSGLYQYADIVPAADLRALRFGFVITTEQPRPAPTAPPNPGAELKR